MKSTVLIFTLLLSSLLSLAQSQATRAQLDADNLALDAYYEARSEAWDNRASGMDPDSVPQPVVFSSSFFYPSTLRLILRSDDKSLNSVINKVEELVFMRCAELDISQARNIYNTFSRGLTDEGYQLIVDESMAKQWLGDSELVGIYGVLRDGHVEKCVMMLYQQGQPFFIADFSGDIAFESLVKLMSADLPKILSQLDVSFLQSLSGQ